MYHKGIDNVESRPTAKMAKVLKTDRGAKPPIRSGSNGLILMGTSFPNLFEVRKKTKSIHDPLQFKKAEKIRIRAIKSEVIQFPV